MSNSIRTVALMTGLIMLLVVIGSAVGGSNGALIALVFGIGQNFFSYWYSDRIVLKMHRAQKVTRSEAPGLLNMVESLSARAQIPMPRVYLINSDGLNAFATGRNPEHGVVAVTRGLVNRLESHQLAGVIAHELAHIRNRDILISSISAAIAAAIMVLARFGMFFGGGDRDNLITTLAMLILAPIAAILIQMAISRSREFIADADGARICGDPLSLASALSALERNAPRSRFKGQEATMHMYIIAPFAGGRGGLRRLFSTHPPTSERILRLREMPYR